MFLSFPFLQRGARTTRTGGAGPEDARGLLSLSKGIAGGDGDVLGSSGAGGEGVSFGERLVACQKQLREFLGSSTALSGSGSGAGEGGGTSLLMMVQRERDELERKLKAKELLCSGGNSADLLGGAVGGGSERGRGQRAPSRSHENGEGAPADAAHHCAGASERPRGGGGGGGGLGGFGAGLVGGGYELKHLKLENEVLKARIQKLVLAAQGVPGSSSSAAGRGSTDTPGGGIAGG